MVRQSRPTQSFNVICASVDLLPCFCSYYFHLSWFMQYFPLIFKMLLSLIMCWNMTYHHSDVRMSTMARQIAGVTIVYSVVCSSTDKKNHQSSASLPFLSGIHGWPEDSPHKRPITRKGFHLMTSSWFFHMLGINMVISHVTHFLLECCDCTLYSFCGKTWLYGPKIRSMPWMLMPCLLASPGHQQSWYWPSRITGPFQLNFRENESFTKCTAYRLMWLIIWQSLLWLLSWHVVNFL